jgi:hypothetical protein
MPNWVHVCITADKKVLEDMIDEKGGITFEKVVPMPPKMKKRGTHLKIMTQAEIDQHWKKYEEYKAAGKLEHDLGYPSSVGITQEEQDELMTKYGVDNWYDWSLEYWGCKWDASSDETWEDVEDYVDFSTAWSPPEAFIQALSKKHPEELIAVEWEEEQGFGQVYIIKNGNIIEVKEEWNLPEWGEEEDVDGYTIAECLSDGGRLDVGIPLFHEGKWYIDWDESQEYDSLEEAKQYLESIEDNG